MSTVQLKYLKVVHDTLLQQLNSFGVVFTLLATIAAVAILQPPGTRVSIAPKFYL